MHRFAIFASVALSLVFPALLCADDGSGPKAIPATRPAAKQALEALKQRTPRLPLPALTDAQVEEANAAGRSVVNNGRMRQLYLPPELSSRSGRREKDPAMTLDNAFGVELFWIASRVNNCHYCLGHQENKLLAAGVPETRIAELDCDWSRFSASDQAAFAFARKLTHRPDQITDKDIEQLKQHFSPLECLEIVLLVSRYNATNRWTDSLGIPQEGHRTFLTETPPEFRSAKSIVAPPSIEGRGQLPSRSETLRQLAQCESRQPRLPLAYLEEAAGVVSGNRDAAPQPQWVRLLANFPIAGKLAIETYTAARDKGSLSEELKAQIAWTAAREDRAWYALHHAKSRLQRLGYEEDRIFDLDSAEAKNDSPEADVRALARKLTSSPQLVEDADIARLRENYSDQQVAEIVYHITQAAFFNRLTEAAGCSCRGE